MEGRQLDMREKGEKQYIFLQILIMENGIFLRIFE